MTSPLADHLHSDPGDGRSECPTCGKWVWLVTHSCKGISVTPSPLPTDEDARAEGPFGMQDIIESALEWQSSYEPETPAHFTSPAEAVRIALWDEGFRRSVVSTPGDAREAVLTSLRRSHVGEMVSKIPEAHRRMVAEGIFDALSAVSAPPTITDEAAVTRAAKALWIADQDDEAWARRVVDDVFSPADDWPQECIEYADRARAAVRAALGGEDKVE